MFPSRAFSPFPSLEGINGQIIDTVLEEKAEACRLVVLELKQRILSGGETAEQ